MRKTIKILAYILGALLLLVATAAAYIQFAPNPAYDPPSIPDLTVKATPERVAEGHRIALMLCNDCHMGSDGKLSGKELKDVPPEFGVFFTQNITQDPENGIGNWSDGELYYFLRTGIRKDGRYAAIMSQFPRVSDEDLFSIIAFLRSDDPVVQPSSHVPPASKPALLGNLLIKTVMRPQPFPDQPVPPPDTLDAVAWGRYLADDLYGCYDCHSANFATNNLSIPEKSKGFYGGGNKLLDEEGKAIYSTNLTPNKEAGLGRYTEAQFVEMLKYGRRPDSADPIRYPMRPHLLLTDSEVKAIYAYLQTLPVLP